MSTRDTFDFSFENQSNDFDSDGLVDASDFQIWNAGRGTSAAEDDNEPGLPGVVIYSDLNFNGTYDTPVGDDFSA